MSVDVGRVWVNVRESLRVGLVAAENCPEHQEGRRQWCAQRVTLHEAPSACCRCRRPLALGKRVSEERAHLAEGAKERRARASECIGRHGRVRSTPHEERRHRCEGERKRLAARGAAVVEGGPHCTPFQFDVVTNSGKILKSIVM